MLSEAGWRLFLRIWSGRPQAGMGEAWKTPEQIDAGMVELFLLWPFPDTAMSSDPAKLQFGL